MKASRWWLSSFAVSAVLLGLLMLAWTEKNRYHPNLNQLVDRATVHDFLQRTWERTKPPDSPTAYVPTGLFIQSLRFVAATDVHITGYVWQKYRPGLRDGLERGFVLPEQVDTGDTGEPALAYRRQQGESGEVELIGWYFESTIRQPFRFDAYPFDHRTVRIRIWPKEFSGNVVLVPDFESYDATGLDDSFGIEPSIVLGGWDRADTFFDYALTRYDTDFGVDGYIGQKGFPELHFNVVVKRKFLNAFIIYLLPLLVVAVLLFAALMTVTGDRDRLEVLGFNATNVIGACSALFFVVLLSHLSLREEFASTTVVYLEYFYFMMYVVLLLVTLNTYLFTTRLGQRLWIVHYDDNLIVKVAYWPLLLGTMLVLTAVTL